MRKPARVVAAVICLAAVSILAACGGGSSSKSGTAPTIQYRTPSSAGTSLAPSPPAGANAGTPGAETLALVAHNISLDKTTLTAHAGTVTITYDNQDTGVTHNLHLFKGTDASGTSVGQTQLQAGPVKQTLTVTLTAGTYHFQCDAHPQQMNGTLTVS